VRLSLSFIFLLLSSLSAWAIDFDNTQTGTIDGTTTCAAPLTRTFTVGTSFTLIDVDLALAATHTWRGDIQLTLTSPAGTSVELITADTGAGGNIDNYNIILDDSATDLVNTGSHATPDGTVAPPYENDVRPDNPLSAFNGQNAQGTWTMSICDEFPGADDGQFTRATLILTEDPAPPTGGTPLSCPVAEQIPFAWAAPGNTNGWAAGSLVNGYTIGTNIPASYAVTGNTNRLIPRNGVNTPVTSTEFTGGGTAQHSLAIYADFANLAETLTVTVNIGVPAEGVASLGFDIFDVDRGGWTDRVTILGSFNGATVNPSLSGAAFNTVSGNSIIGTAQAPSTSGAGNAQVVFTTPVDQFTITYDNGPSAPANPAAQIMSFFANLVVCPPLVADLSAVKSVEVADPGLGLYMTPGNEVIYKITVTNGPDATTPANNIDISDTLPDNLTFLSAAVTGFTGGTLAGPSANTNCTGGNCTVALTGASLLEDQTAEIRVRVRIQ
jgi:uncharacterized repeat protein (TIGR01451 family)